MKIALNARFLNYPYTGIGQYTRNLLAQISHISSSHTFYFLSPFRHSDLSDANIVYLPERHLGHRSLNKLFWETKIIPGWCQQNQIDILHHLYPVPLSRKAHFKQIMTIHDVIPWTHSQYRTDLKTKIYQYLVLRRAILADYVITVSNSTKQELFYLDQHLRLNRIGIVYQAHDPIFEQKFSSAEIAKVCQKYHIEHDFLLYVGGYDARKNTATLLKAFQKSKAVDNKIDLLCVGGKILNQNLYADFDKLKKIATRSNGTSSQGRLILPGFVDQSDLAALYQGALAFINFSLAEGFNISICEAAVSGCPMLLSNIPVHREITDEKVLFCNPDDLVDCIAKINEMIDNTVLRQHLSQNSAEISQKYTWKNTLDKTLNLYQELTN